jgi:hypothetical protein
VERYDWWIWQRGSENFRLYLLYYVLSPSASNKKPSPFPQRLFPHVSVAVSLAVFVAFDLRRFSYFWCFSLIPPSFLPSSRRLYHSRLSSIASCRYAASDARLTTQDIVLVLLPPISSLHHFLLVAAGPPFGSHPSDAIPLQQEGWYIILSKSCFLLAKHPGSGDLAEHETTGHSFLSTRLVRSPRQEIDNATS